MNINESLLRRPYSTYTNFKERPMRNLKLIVAALLLVTTGPICLAATKSKTETPATSPGWLVIEDDVWTPLRFEPLHSLDAASYHYRRDEETAAANELDKSVSWLKIAAEHALPITKEKLTAAATDLTFVANDLRAGRTRTAADWDGLMAKAASALAEWHYYRAKGFWGKNEEADAGRDLEMAAEYLQHAANSAHYEFGPDTQNVITKIYHDGKLISETKGVDHNTLGMHLEGVERAVKDLGAAMVKATT